MRTWIIPTCNILGRHTLGNNQMLVWIMAGYDRRVLAILTMQIHNTSSLFAGRWKHLICALLDSQSIKQSGSILINLLSDRRQQNQRLAKNVSFDRGMHAGPGGMWRRATGSFQTWHRKLQQLWPQAQQEYRCPIPTAFPIDFQRIDFPRHRSFKVFFLIPPDHHVGLSENGVPLPYTPWFCWSLSRF